MNENRGSWYLLTGIIIGIGLGLLVSWVLWPTRYRDNAPASLSEEYKDNYRALIAAAYMASGDVERARSRLVLLMDADMAAALITQAQRSMVAGRPEAEVRALSLLGLTLASGDGPTPDVTFPPTVTPLTPPSRSADLYTHEYGCSIPGCRLDTHASPDIRCRQPASGYTCLHARQSCRLYGYTHPAYIHPYPAPAYLYHRSNLHAHTDSHPRTAISVCCKNKSCAILI